MEEKKDASGNVGLNENHIRIINYVCSQTHLTQRQALAGLQQLNGDYKKVIKLATIEHLIGIVMRQTTYTRKEAIEKLKKFDGEPVDVIKEFMGIEKKEKETPKSTNQKVFHEIRNFMDDVNKGYNQRKEQNQKIKKIQEMYAKKVSES